jgi:hypothetical protein
MNATVTLPISELDNLRDTIKDLTSKCADYEKTSKQIKLTLIDKRYEFSPQDAGWNRCMYVKDIKLVESHQYINLEDVIDILKYEQEQLVVEKLSKLNYEIKTLKENHSKALLTHENNADILKKKYEEELKKKDDALKILKGELIDLDKDKQIFNLNKQLEVLKATEVEISHIYSMSFFQKLKFLFL